uniref:Uncharacterized protein n=1 Tax=Arundo donax TaxID=35708 RepID=A0A0A8ZKH3_ARUDO
MDPSRTDELKLRSFSV